MIVEKDIARLSIGSYVVVIVKQRGTRKLKHKGWVKSLRVIEKLIELGVERVSIDTSKVLANENSKAEDSLDSDNATLKNESNTDTKISLKANDLLPKGMPSSKQIEKKKNSSNLTPKSKNRDRAKSLKHAKSLFNEAKQIQKKIFEDIVGGRQVEFQAVKDITEQTTETIFDNPDALACIINIRAKDDYLLEHSASVSILITIFARYLKLDKQLSEELAIGAFLHDVGKIKIPDSILSKPGKLTEAEFEIMKTHVDHSIQIIADTPGLSDLSMSVAACHHEKLDGSGYPNGLRSNDISQYGRMITICDIYDALTADRVYKCGLAQVKSFSILLKMAEQNMLDVSLVNQFIKCMGVYPVGSLVKLSSNQLAVVEERNAKDPIRPKVKTFYSVSQNHFVGSKEIDLSDDSNEQIEKGVRANEFNLDMNKILEFLIMDG
ncbi:MAG: HD-GYP domain-containing protein [Kangiellaceae bacterium]|nr:HD-GYP domain-containing protein [Kangiellaceae bacterium]